MPKARRTYPGFLKTEPGPQGQAFIDCISGVLGGGFDCAPLFLSGDKAHVFVVSSPSRCGVLIEATEKPGAEVGEWVSDLVFLYDRYSPEAPLYAELTVHAWDPWLAAEQTGDRSLVDGPRGKRNRERDERSLSLARNKDRFTLTCLPYKDCPESFLGVGLEESTLVLKQYGERMVSSLPHGLSIVVVPPGEARSTTHASDPAPSTYGIHIVNDGEFIVPCAAVEARASGAEGVEYPRRPPRRFSCVVPPGGSVQIDELNLGELSYINTYFLAIVPPRSDSAFLATGLRVDLLTPEHSSHLKQLRKRGLPLPPAGHHQ